jgi:hypothetical protein
MSSGDMMNRGPGAPVVTASRKRGFFGKLKDKAIGTKEEREAERRRMEEVGSPLRDLNGHRLICIQKMRARRRDQFLAQQAARQAYYAQQQQFDGPYGPPMEYRQGRRGGGVALPLLGGLAGGLLLGDILDGGFDGGGFGGGFDGGGFDGGGFDGGFF